MFLVDNFIICPPPRPEGRGFQRGREGLGPHSFRSAQGRVFGPLPLSPYGDLGLWIKRGGIGIKIGFTY